MEDKKGMDIKRAAPLQKASLKSAKGFALTLLLALLPLLLTALLGAAALTPLLSKLTLAEDQCRKGTLNAQSVLLTSLSRLLKLSEVNEKLYQLEMKAVKLVKSSALNPAALKAALALLNSIRKSQQALNLAQSTLIATGEMRAGALMARTALQLSRSQRYLGQSYLASAFLSSATKLHVDKIRKGSSDIYQVSANFEKAQEVSGEWDMNPMPHFESWTTKFIPPMDRIHIRCTAGVQRKGAQSWEPVVIEVRRSLKSWG